MRKLALGLAALIVAAAACFGGCQKNEKDWGVYMPDGAPALAFALPMSEDNDNDGLEYHVVAATSIQAYVTGKTPDAEVCVLPVNLAAKLLGDGSTYQMVGVATHGNLYLVSQDDVQYTQKNVSALIGKTIGVAQLNNVPGLTLKAALGALGVPYNDLSSGGAAKEDAVNLRAANPLQLSGADLYLLPSPVAEQKSAQGFSIVGSLQQIYGGENGYPQAAIVAKKSVLEKDAEKLSALLAKVDANTAWLKTSKKESIINALAAHLPEGMKPTFTAATLTDEVITHCGVWMQYMDENAVVQVDEFLKRLTKIDGEKAAVPVSSFYRMCK